MTDEFYNFDDFIDFDDLLTKKNPFQVLLVSSSKDHDKWVVPGGKMEPKDQASFEFVAIREALEEGGVIGRLGRCLGTFDDSDRGHRTKVFVLYVNKLAEEYEDKDVKKRKWFSMDEAQKMLSLYKPLHAKYLVALKQSKSMQTPSTTVSE